ncbi:phospholipase D-like domain-containing protein [Variovorax sp. HJSM1_2]|uniref:phospholipase D-like domain-containing protein n=1 Tax=Variovorax sp. HJSM1_2 TaxID=3366263 RepID=UPI003BE88EA7
MAAFLATLLCLQTLSGCASLPPPPSLRPSHAIAEVAQSPLAQLAARSLPADGSVSGFRLMPEAATALNARLKLAAEAKHSIDAQYYILEDDPVGLLFLASLRAAAQRGVRVRLLVDDLYAGSKYPLYAALAAEPKLEIRLFNPLPAQGESLVSRLLLSLWELRRINHRMHNKLFVVDNSWAVLGGRNIAAEYFMQNAMANFIDIDLLACGQVVGELSSSFDRYWNSPDARPIASLTGTEPAGRMATNTGWLDQSLAAALPAPEAERAVDLLGESPVATQMETGRAALIGGTARVLVDPPEKIRQADPDARFASSVTQQTLQALGMAQQQVILISPYFVPGERGLQLIRDNAARGVKTIVFTNSLEATDETLVYAGYARYRWRLLRAGVRLYELGARLSGRNHELGDFKQSLGRLHAKVAIIDDRQLFLGSMNLDSRSARLNTEVGLIIESQALARTIARLSSVRLAGAYEVRVAAGDNGLEWVSRAADQSEAVRLDEPGADWLLSLKNWFLSQLISEEQL